MKRHKGERGQVVLLVLIAMGLFLIGAIGLGVDGSNLYMQFQMAQAAADAAAQAAMLSVFDGTNTSGSAAFGTSAFTCGTTSGATPCVYARNNGFGGTAKDTVSVDFNDNCPGPTTGLASDPVNRTCVTITRNVGTTLMRFVGPTGSNVKAKATAAVLEIDQAPPILVLNPTAPNALDLQGTPDVTITGGPLRSIQVNSSASNAVHCGGSSSMSLSGTLGAWGGPTTPPCSVPASQYVQPASPILDPLATVPAPANPGPPIIPPCVAGSKASGGCPGATTYGAVPGSMVYFPGSYQMITIKHEFATFMPGLYYLSNGDLSFESNSSATMGPCPSTIPPTPSPNPITGCGMVVYFANGGISAGSNADNITLLGSPVDSIYKGILFFSRSSGTSDFGGGGSITLTGTIYLPNQSLDLGGHGGNQTQIIGEIIVDTLSLGGNSAITMTLSAAPTLVLRQVALVH